MKTAMAMLLIDEMAENGQGLCFSLHLVERNAFELRWDSKL
jgi:hypothetical protein